MEGRTDSLELFNEPLDQSILEKAWGSVTHLPWAKIAKTALVALFGGIVGGGLGTGAAWRFVPLDGLKKTLAMGGAGVAGFVLGAAASHFAQKGTSKVFTYLRERSDEDDFVDEYDEKDTCFTPFEKGMSEPLVPTDPSKLTTDSPIKYL